MSFGTYQIYSVIFHVKDNKSLILMQSVITCLPFYNITKSVAPLIRICRDQLYESKH